MSLEKFKNSIHLSKRLLESDTLGTFDFFTNTVCLDSIDSAEMAQLFQPSKGDNYEISSKILPLAVHEYTHFIDSTSTLWGFRHLVKMDKAYSSNYEKGGEENDFYLAKDFLEHVRSLRLPKYYTTINKGVNAEKPWGFQISVGKQFALDGKLSDKPILFARFVNRHSSDLVRSPISTVSILEASAMAQEMMVKAALIDSLDEQFRGVESHLFERASLSYLYNRDLTEYSVCVHILANHLKCSNALVAFSICAVITRIVLNFPLSLFKSVIENCPIDAILRIPKGSAFEQQIRIGLEGGNLGILYYLICKALPSDSALNQSKTLEGVTAAMEMIGVSMENLIFEAGRETKESLIFFKDSRIRSLRTISSAGLKNFSMINFNTAAIPFYKLHLPRVYLGDGEQVSIFKNVENDLKDIDLDTIFDDLYEGQEWVDRFSEACTA